MHSLINWLSQYLSGPESVRSLFSITLVLLSVVSVLKVLQLTGHPVLSATLWVLSGLCLFALVFVYDFPNPMENESPNLAVTASEAVSIKSGVILPEQKKTTDVAK